jgi:hypothetical protein
VTLDSKAAVVKAELITRFGMTGEQAAYAMDYSLCFWEAKAVADEPADEIARFIMDEYIRASWEA